MRPSGSLVSVTDELTVSRSDIGGASDIMLAGGKSYRSGHGDLDSMHTPILRNQNRTFAESVMDIHLNGLKSTNNANTALKLSSSQSKANQDFGSSQTLDARVAAQQRNLASYLDGSNASDSISELDILTKTQISTNNMQQPSDPHARSRIMIPQLLQDSLSHSQITSNEPSQPTTKRTTQNNLFNKIINDTSSLNFTPEKEREHQSSQNSLNWQLKSQAPQQEQELNPISQLKERIKQSNIQQKRQQTQCRDQELYEALESQPDPIQHQSKLQGSAGSSAQNMQLQERIQELSDQNRQLATSCQVLQTQLQQAQQQKPVTATTQQDLLKMRALEAARQDRKEALQKLEQQETQTSKLQCALADLEAKYDDRVREIKQNEEQYQLQLDKLKILQRNAKRESESTTDHAKAQLEQSALQLQSVLVSNQELNEQIRQNEAKLRQQVQDSHSHLQQRDHEIQSLEAQLKQIGNDMARMEVAKHTHEQDSLQWKQKCREQEEELEQIGRRNHDNHNMTSVNKNQEQGFDAELRRLKDKHAQQMAKLQEQLFQATSSLKDKDALVQALQKQPKTPVASESHEAAIVKSLQGLLGVHECASLTGSVQELVTANAESLQKLKENEINERSQATQILHLEEQLQHFVQKEAAAKPENTHSAFTQKLLQKKDIELQNLKEAALTQSQEMHRLETQLVGAESALNQLQDEKLALQQEVAAQRRLSIQQQLSKESSLKEAEIQAEIENLESLTERQNQIIQQYEIQVKQFQEPQFQQTKLLKALDDLILQPTDPQHASLMQKIKELKQDQLQADLSQIYDSDGANEGNPLQDKSGKHEAALFLSHLSQKEQPRKDAQCQASDETQKQLVEHLQNELAQKTQAFSMYNQQLSEELQLNKDELDIKAQDSLESERQKHKQEISDLQRVYESKLKELKDENDFRLQELQVEFQQEQSLLSVQTSSRSQKTETQLQQVKLELKQLKQANETQSKAHLSKLQRVHQDHSQALQELQQQQTRSQEDEVQKAKQATKAAVEKAQTQVRSELMNKICELKNEHAKAQAEWQRTQSRHSEITDKALEAQLQKLEAQQQKEVNSAKAIVERMWKKRLDQLEIDKLQSEQAIKQGCEDRLAQQDAHNREEVKKMQKQWSSKLKELQEQPQSFFAAALEEQATQVTPKSARVQNMPLQPSPQSMAQQPSLEHKLAQQQLFIDQLKVNFELEMEKQEQSHLTQQTQKGKQLCQSLESLLSLELEKILVTLNFKAQNQNTPAASQQELNAQRAGLNSLMKQLFGKQPKEFGKDVKRAFEAVKEKFTVVLSTLKSQLEMKYTQRQLQERTINNSTIQIEDTMESTTEVDSSQDTTQKVSLDQHQMLHQLQLQRQSIESKASSTEGLVMMNMTAGGESVVQMSSPPTSTAQAKQSFELQSKYLEYASTTDSNPVNRLAPQSQNSRGALVVEVEKVVRDLQMLYETTKMAKFCRILLGPNSQATQDDSVLASLNSARSSTQQDYVAAYRDLLNSFFRLVSKLNQASDQATQDQETFRLRLLNVDLTQKLSHLQREQSGVVTRQLVQDILQHYQKQQSHNGQVSCVLDALEQLHFQISKNQFKLNQLADLFTCSQNGQVVLNVNRQEVQQKCEEFAKTQDAFLESSFHNDQLKTQAELMSPDETAQLIATVIQKLPNRNSYNEDVLKQALTLCQQEQSMPPLQQLQQHNTIQSATSQISRSRSTGQMQPPPTYVRQQNMPRQIVNSNQSLYQTVEQTPTNLPQQYRTQRNLKAVNYPVSANVQLKRGNDRYRAQQQQHEQYSSISGFTQTQHPQMGDNDDDFQSEQCQPESKQRQVSSLLDEELQSAQTNVNQLFEKIQQKSRFNTLQY